VRSPFFAPASEHQADCDGDKVHHSAVCIAPRNAVVSGFQERGDWTDAKSCAESCIEANLALRLRSDNIALHVVEAAAEDDVWFHARTWKRIDQITEQAHHPQIVRADPGTGGQDFLVRQIVINPIKAKTDGQLGYSDRQA
jgi:hypothetical protein